MTIRPVKLALIGCGRIAQLVHLPLLRAMKGAELVALADPQTERLQQAQRHFAGVETYADYRELLERSRAVGPIDDVDKAAAPGMQLARADLVATIEDHVYPEPGWAQAVIAAHARGPWAVVGAPSARIRECLDRIGAGPIPQPCQPRWRVMES